MNIHAISTGKVQITQNWVVGREGPLRAAHAFLDRRFTEWLPIFCFVVEHPEGLIVVDTGIPADANKPIWFPPHMRLIQQAARFQVTAEDEIGPQMRARGLDPLDVRWVALTHLHQDHDGGLHHFPKAEFVLDRAEWRAASGLAGRMGGYLNRRWPGWFSPRLVDFDAAPYGPFPASLPLTRAGDVTLVSTRGHSAGHLSVVVSEGDRAVFIAGDTSYTQDLLLARQIDGVAVDPAAERTAHGRILDLAAQTPLVYLPSHEWASAERLAAREAIPAG